MEKEKKQKLIKILEGVGYGLIMLIMLCWAFACGYKQSRDLDYLKNTVSEIRENQEKQKEITSNLLDNRTKISLRDSLDPNITNLAGSNWTFNSGLSLVAVPEFEYDVEFTSNNTNYSYLASELDGRQQSLYYNTTLVYSVYVSGGSGNFRSAPTGGGESDWSNENYRTIAFTGGDDISNSGLISFMYDNAELISYNPPSDPEPEPEPVLNPYNLNARYDFRKWFGEVDPLTGCIQYSWQSGDNNKIYDIGVIVVGEVEYSYLRVAMLKVTNAINIITGYDYQNQCYLAMGGGDYYAGSEQYSIILSIELLDASTVSNASHRLNMYNCPLVGARMRYDSGNPLSPDDYTPATGYLCATFELNQTAINWNDYQPSNQIYNLPGIGNNLTVYEVLQLDLLNDTYMDFYSISASASGGNIFDLISNAFKTLVPILSIQVIPGLPIGLLVVLPLVATILVVVIKLVRK